MERHRPVRIRRGVLKRCCFKLGDEIEKLEIFLFKLRRRHSKWNPRQEVRLDPSDALGGGAARCHRL